MTTETTQVMTETGRHDGSEPSLTDRPLAELVRRLSDQTTTLVRQELDLAKAELAAKGKQAGLGAGLFGAAGVLGLYAVGALTACLILALSLVLAGWLAALVVAVVYGAIAGGLALAGKARIQKGVPPVPERAVESVKEDVQWTKQRAKDGRR
jgi:Putative Actinobacterial Holin-X, holin superfamily III